ncbi:MAG: nucleotide exchange factor GrpE [Patescibacteria group bacterium]|nr:nucleotide exchange factor GrpE [Patescibacteria group bacterium]
MSEEKKINNSKQTTDNSNKVKPGIYKHYKDKKYKVLFIAEDSETQEEMVVYQAMYGEGKIWVRPKRIFLEEVEIDGKKVPRFKFESPEENDWQNKYLRALADYQNLLKRTAQEKVEFVKYANEDLILSIIPVYDNLKMSLAHTDETVEKNGWLEGIKHVIRQFKDVLASMGVEEIKTIGEKFDHNTMEAIEGKGDKVVKELRPGYKLNGKVIVAAKVVVK